MEDLVNGAELDEGAAEEARDPGAEAEAYVRKLAHAYQYVFNEADPEARLVMDDLGRMFGFVGVSMYQPGEQNASSNTIMRAGQQSVLQYILAMVKKGQE